MYIPKHFELRDPDAVRRMVGRYGFALLVTPGDGVPEATHLPLLHDPEPTPHGRVLGHISRANGQARQLEAAMRKNREVLAVFHGPHTYVSPNDYGSGPVTVPTWNYIAVHIYGVPRLIADGDELCSLIEQLTARHEGGRADSWSPTSLDPGLMRRMLRGILGFEIRVSRVEAKAKLSQNRDPAQAARAAQRLEASDDSLVRETGRLMRAVLAAAP